MYLQALADQLPRAFGSNVSGSGLVVYLKPGNIKGQWPEAY